MGSIIFFWVSIRGFCGNECAVTAFGLESSWAEFVAVTSFAHTAMGSLGNATRGVEKTANARMVKFFRYINNTMERNRSGWNRKNKDFGAEPDFLFLPKGLDHVAADGLRNGGGVIAVMDASRPYVYLLCKYEGVQ